MPATPTKGKSVMAPKKAPGTPRAGSKERSSGGTSMNSILMTGAVLIGVTTAVIGTGILGVELKSPKGEVLYTVNLRKDADANSDASIAGGGNCPKCATCATCGPDLSNEVGTLRKTVIDRESEIANLKANRDKEIAKVKESMGPEMAKLQGEIQRLQAEAANKKGGVELPDGQMALVGFDKMVMIHQNQNMDVTRSLANWNWILQKMDLSVKSLGDQAPPQGIQYIQQMKDLLGQVRGVPTRENYNMFFQNVEQVKNAIQGILASTGELPLQNAFLPAPLRGELCQGWDNCA